LELRPEWSKFLQDDGGLLMRLLKAWYGSKPAPALWHEELKKTLKELGYTQHPKVACIFMHISDGVTSYLLLHVDDLGGMFPTDGVEKRRVKAYLESKYNDMRVQDGDNVVYIGFEVFRNRKQRRFEIGMKTRIDKIVKKWNITKTKKLPYRSNLCQAVDETEPCSDVTDYRSLVMTCRYIAMTCKPEILFVCSYLSTFQSEPTVRNYSDALHMLEYLNGVSDERMYIYGIGENPTVRVYADSAFQIHKDNGSHGGLDVFVGRARCTLYSASNKIRCQCNDSTEAEIVEWHDATFIGDYFSQVLDDLGIDHTVVYMQDNESAISLGVSGTIAYDSKRKHIIKCINSIKAYLDESGATVESVISQLMYADGRTKNLEGDHFMRHKKVTYGWYSMLSNWVEFE
jgi:hypothetical protein